MRKFFRYIRRFAIAGFLIFASLLLVLQIPSLNTRVFQGIVNLVTPSDMHIRIRGIRGAFPFDMTIEKIKIKDNRSVWLEIQNIAVDWRGIDLLYGNIHLANLSAQKLTFWRSPEMVTAESSPGPMTLPRLNIDKLGIEAIELPNLLAGSFQLDGNIQSVLGDSHRVQLDLRFSDLPEHVDTLIYTQKGIDYTLQFKIDRPLLSLSRLSPDFFSKIDTGNVLLDIDIKGDTYFKFATGHVQGEFLDFQTSDNNLQELLGENPKINLVADGDDTGNVRNAHGELILGANRELSFSAVPHKDDDFTAYSLNINIRTPGQEGSILGDIFIKDEGIALENLNFTGLGSNIQGSLKYYTNALSAQLSGKIHDLSALAGVINYPAWGTIDLDMSYHNQDLSLNIVGKSILLGADKTTAANELIVKSNIIEGAGNFNIEAKRDEISIDIGGEVRNWWQEVEVRKLFLIESENPVVYLNKPFTVTYKDGKLMIPDATIRNLDGRLVIKNLELSDTPKGEIILDKVTAKILDPLIDKVEWQGELIGKLAFSEDPSMGYYRGNLKLVDFGRRSELKKTEKLLNLAMDFSHTGQVFTIDVQYKDSTTSDVKGKIQINSNSYIPQETDPFKTSFKGIMDFSVLNGLVWWGDRFKGKMHIEQSAQGTVGKPNSQVKATLSDGYYENAPLGTVIKDIHGTFSYSNEKLAIAGFTGKDLNNGSFILKGSANFQNLFAPTLNMNLDLDKLMLANTDQVVISASGKLSAITIEAHHHQLKGNILINSALINLAQVSSEPKTITVFRTEEELLKKQSKPHKELQTTLDIKIDIPRKLLVQGYGLRSEWKGNLSIIGPANSPQIDGSIHSISGRLDISSKRLILAPSSVSFSTVKGEIIPILDIKTTKQVREYDTFISLLGSSKEPKIEFTSIPTLPTEDVIALILFGKPISEVSAAQSLQLATTMAAVKAGDFSSGAFDSLNHLLGVDDISLQQAETAEAVDGDQESYSLSIGKQLSDRIYVGIDQGLQEGVGTQVKMKVDVTKNTKISVETGTQNTAASYGWEFRY